MARSVSFDNGLGLELHARTEIVRDWSLIKSAALKIGNDTLELTNDGTIYFNKEKNEVKSKLSLAGKHPVFKNEMYIDVQKEDANVAVPERKTILVIQLDPKHNKRIQIQMQLFMGIVSVQVKAYLDDTEGMLGVHNKKGLVGRDRETLAIDADEMGFHWQVQDTEPKLFRDIQAPQFPQLCMMPSMIEQKDRHRRLKQATSKSKRAAEVACSGIETVTIRSFCINDVLLTGDTSVANSYGFVPILG
jgi:hypothetical protein